MLAVQRALPIAITRAARWAAKHTTRDPLTACAAAITMLALFSLLLDRAVLSQRFLVGWIVRASKLAVGSLLAALLSWTLARTFGGGETIAQPTLLLISAGVLAGFAVATRYRTA